jgi:autotransporter-associated beta strand protein/uncharacterized repeat protein (TIGR03803 family)
MLLASAFSVSQLPAADRTWNGAGTNNNWSNSSNWNALAVSPGDSLFFAGSTRLTPSNDFTAGTTFTNITFNSGAGAFVLLGSPISLAGNITNNQPNGTETIGLDLAPTTTAFISITSNGFVNVTGSISGAFGLTKTGLGRLTLSGANSFTGAVTVAQGTLRVNHDSALGVTNGIMTVNSGATLDVGAPSLGVNGLDLGDEFIVIVSNGVSGAGAIISTFSDAQQNALQHVTLTGDATIGGTGPWTVSGGNPGRWDIRGTPATSFLSTGGQPYNLTKWGSNEVRLAGVTVDAALANIDILQGAFGIEGNTTSLGNTNNTLTVHPGATLEFVAATNRLNKKIVLIGDGVNESVNNRSGNNTILGPITLSNQCVFQIGGNGTTLTNRGPISGSGSLEKTGGATGGSKLVLTATNTYTGDTLVSVATLNLSGTGSISNSPTITVAAGGILDVLARTDRTFIVNSGQTLKGDGSILGRLTIAPGGTISPGTNALGFIVINSNADFTGFAQMEINRTNTPNSDRVTGISTATYGGTLTVTNLGPALQAGDSFTLFAATNYTGTFGFIYLPPMPPDLAWDTSGLAVNGSIRVVAVGNKTWTGLGTNNNWTTGSNWNASVVPGDSLFFDGSTRLTPSNDFTAGTTFSNLTFSSGAGPFTLLGNSIALAGNITNNQVSGTETIGLNLIPTSTAFITVVSNGTGDGSLTISGAISGSFGFIKAGGGLLTLSGANTFTGAATVAQGTLALSGSGSISSSAFITIVGGAILNASARTDRTLTLANGQTLKGDGLILGRLTIAPGATIAPGNNTLGFITIVSNADFTGLAQMEINRTNTPNCDFIVITSNGPPSIAYGGTLTVSNLGPALQAGDTFTLFQATNYTGSFGNIYLPPLAGGLAWDTSGLATNGSIRVVSPTVFSLLCATNKTVECSLAATQTTYTVLRSFSTNGADGRNLYDGVIEGADGALYGTTEAGGSNNVGTVFKLNMDGTGYTVLRNFLTNGLDGHNPYSAVIEASDGALYGTTYGGGSNNAGAVFKLNKDGTGFAILRNFSTNGTDGQNPYSGVVEGADGDLYGTTYGGGSNGVGTVFKLNKDGIGYTVLRVFNNADGNGRNPAASLIEASDGDLYGTTHDFGSTNFGTVFKLHKDGTGFTVLRSFTTNGADGHSPYSEVIEASDGDLYGTTFAGGTNNGGTVFKLHKDGTGYTILRIFSSTGNDGHSPYGGLVEGRDGSLYGSTQTGGNNNLGTLFKLNRDGTGYSMLHSMTNSGGDGRNPRGNLLQASDGAFYGTTESGGSNLVGTIFRLQVPCSWEFDPPLAANACCGGSNVVVTVLNTITNGICPQVITRTWQATDCCSNTATCSQSVTLVDNQLLVITCPGNITTNISGTNVVVNYPAPTVANGTLLGCTPPSGSVFPAGTTLVTCTATNTCATNNCTFNVTVQRIGAPIIITQPQNLGVTQDVACALTVAASGDGLQYQWFFNGFPLNRQTSSTFSMRYPQAGINGGQYSVRVSNALGSVTSAPAIVTVWDAPTIISENWRLEMNDPTANVFKTVREAEAWLEANDNPEDEEGGNEDEFNRWRYFAEGRADVLGSLSSAMDAMAMFGREQPSTRQPGCNCVLPVAPGWANMGPSSLPRQDNGVIISLYIHPNNFNFILAGSNSGGLWKTTDGGINWSCITENACLPGMGINSIAVQANFGNQNQTIYIATGISTVREGYGLGVLKTIDGGVNWFPTGPELTFDPAQGEVVVRKVIVHPSPPYRILYACTERKFYQSIDWGGNWTQIGTTLPDGQFFTDIQFSAYNPDRVYVTGNVLWRWNDTLQTWTDLSSGMTAFTREYLQNTDFSQTPLWNHWTHNNDLLWAIQSGQAVTTTDFGTSAGNPIAILSQNYQFLFGAHGYPANYEVKVQNVSIPASTTCTIQLRKDATHTMLIGSQSGPFNGAISFQFVPNDSAYVSIEFVFTTTAATPPSATLAGPSLHVLSFQRIGISANDLSKLYVLYQMIGQSARWLEKYDEAGTGSWSSPLGPNIPTGNNEFGYWRPSFVVSQADPNVMYVSGNTMWKSTDGGRNFASISGYYASDPPYYTHGDVRTIQILNATPGGAGDTVFMGNDGGISKTINGGLTWANLNGQGASGICANQFFGIAGYQGLPNLVVGGTQDGGPIDNSTGAWRASHGNGDTYRAAVDLFDSKRMYAGNNGNPPSIWRSADGGATWPSTTAPAGNAATDRPIFIAPNNVLYTGYHDAWWHESAINQWHQISDFTTQFGLDAGRTLKALAVAASDTNVVYAGFGGATWGGTVEKKLFRTENSSALAPTWRDITSGLPIAFAGISDIIVDPNDPNRIWVTFENIWESSIPGAGINRVWAGVYSGSSMAWTEYSTGLPVFPVNCITYDAGSQDGLYVGTDVGVFYRDKNMPAWVCFNNHLPNSIVTDLDINYCARTIKAATFGRGIWQSSLPAVGSRVPAIISTSTIWNTDRRLYTDLTIPTGVELIIKGKVYVASDSTITIQPGGRLVVDGGTLTTDCPCLWQGIALLGIPTATQYPLLGSPQGVLIIKNGATIENAREAVTSFYGGVVQATDSFFKNNRRSSAFLSYENFVGTYPPPTSKIRNNLSFFQNCTFQVDGPIKCGSSGFNSFVTMWKTRGVGFYGNTFINNAPGSFAVNNRGLGIYSIDAAYFVTPLCTCGICTFPCPPQYTVPNHFENLFSAVEAHAASDPARHVAVQGCQMVNNYRGVTIQGHQGPAVNQNDVSIAPYAGFGIPYGLLLENSSGYSVVENNFHRVTPSIWAGVFVNNSGTANNLIYKNTFNGLTVGSYAYGINSSIHTGLGPFTGLQLRCNNYQAGSFDMVVASGSINLFQGWDNNGTALPAGNAFSHNCTSGSVNDIAMIPSPQPFHYYFYNSGLTTTPLCYSQPQVTPLPLSQALSCPDPFSGWMKAQLQELVTSNFLKASNLLAQVSGQPFVPSPGFLSPLGHTNSEISDLLLGREEAINELVRQAMTEPDTNGLAFLINTLELERTLSILGTNNARNAAIRLVSLYRETGNLPAAEQVLAGLCGDADLAQFCALETVFNDLARSNATPLQMSAQQSNVIFAIAASGAFGSGRAQGLLALVSDQPPLLQVALRPDLVQPALVITNVAYSGTNLSFSFDSFAEAPYAAEYKDSLNDTNWTTLQTFIGTGSPITVQASTTEHFMRFYRIRLK